MDEDEFWHMNVAELVAAVEKESKHAPLDWLATNAALVDRFKTDIARLYDESENLVCARRSKGVYKYNRKEELDKLFEKDRDSEALRDPNVKHFLINRVLDEFRPNIRRLSALAIERTICAFCFSQHKDVEQHALDVYDFLMDCLELRPPLNSDLRWFWLCIVTADHADPNDDGQVRDNVRKFIDKCCAIFKNEFRPDEYKLFLLTLLEYDYAATVARKRLHLQTQTTTQTATASVQRASSSASASGTTVSGDHKRNVPLTSVTDLDDFPLAYLLLCSVHSHCAYFSEHPNNKLNTLLLDFLMLFNPANPEQHIRTSRLYARLIGLLLDVLLFVESGADPCHQVIDQGQLSERVRMLLLKVRKQNNAEEWATFVDLAGVPWVREFVDLKESTRRSLKDGSTKKSQQQMIS